MSSRTAFKNALQSLTTIVVKAEAAHHQDEAAFQALREAGLAEWKRLRELHARFVAEVRAADPAAPVPHASWLESTEKRAEALFGPSPAA
jgi:hypothetical protein